MGWVWNVLLTCSSEEFAIGRDGALKETCGPIIGINKWVPDGKLVSLTAPTYAKGAGSGMNACVFGGGFKHFDIEGFVRVVEAQAWKDRANVQLWIRGDADGRFTEIQLRPRRSPVSTSKPNLRVGRGRIRRPEAQPRGRNTRR